METTRNTVINIIHRHYTDAFGDPVPHQLNRCSAWYSGKYYNIDEDVHYQVLQSYNTPVALYVYETNTVYRLGTWSNTTAQHQHKFKRMLNADTMVDLGGQGLYRGWR